MHDRSEVVPQARDTATRGTFTRIVIPLAILFALDASAQVVVPPAGTPGGARPQVSAPAPTMSADTGPMFAIPPVFERPLGVDEGERIFVKGFVLKGIEDDLRAGVRTAEVEARVQQRFEDLQKLIEELRVSKQNQGDVDADGYNPEEKAKVLAFIKDVLATVDPEQQVEAYQSFIQGLKLQRLERDAGLTIGQLGLIADEVTKYFRQRGYFLARAVIPAQEVVGGIVTIRVLEGRLGEVVAEGNDRFEDADLSAPFDDIKGKLINVERIEDALLTVQAYPGIGATGVFRPGKVVGTADMVVNVQREKIHEFTVRADNHGSAFTGANRLVLDYTWNGPLHDADLLNLQAVQTFEPDNSLYGGLRYETKFDDPDHRWGFSVNNNTFDVTDASGITAVSGVSKEGRLYYNYQLQRSRTKKTKFTAELLRKVGDTTSAGSLLSRDEEAVVGMQIDTEVISAATSTISSMYLRVDQGFDGYLGVPSCDDLFDPATTLPPYSRAQTCGDFTKFSAGYSALKSLAPTRSILFRFAAQWTADRLTSLEQFNLGGVNTVRAGATSSALRDYGAYGSIEFQSRGLFFGDKQAWSGRTWNQVLGASFFYDYAVGLTNMIPTESINLLTQKIRMGGPGVSLDLVLPGEVTMKFQYAHMNTGQQGNPGDPGSITDSNQVWVEFQRSF